jgi:3-oxoacyl-[acyl-carrier-protein] synthase-1
MEAGFCWMMLRQGDRDGLCVAPHVYDGARDPDLPPVPLAGEGQRVPRGPVMTNSFGFGGNNCTLVLEAARA